MRLGRLARRVIAAFTVGIGVLAPEPAATQATASVIKGILKEGATGRPIANARVTLLGSTLSTLTNARGEFEFPELVPGRYVVRAAAVGYAAIASPVQLQSHQTMELEFITEAEAVTLPEIQVSEPDHHGPPDWNRRRAEGRGRYVTRADIEHRNVATVPDMLRQVPGVRIDCRSGSVCRVRMARAPRGCEPAFFMDGIPSDRSIAYLTPIRDVEGIELYSGPAETPPELESVQARCGVVVIWTRTPPRRRLRPTKTTVDTILSPPVDTLTASPRSF